MFGFLLALLTIGFILSFFFSGFETGAYALSTLRFELKKSEDARGAKRLAELLKNMPLVIATTLVGTNVGNYLLTASSLGLLQLTGFFDSAQKAELTNTLLMTPFVFMFAEVIPKEVFRRHADRLVYRSVRPFSMAHFLVRPLTFVLISVPAFLRRMKIVPEVARTWSPSMLERFSIELTRGTETGALTANQAIMAKRIIDLESRRVEHAMLPLNKVLTVNVEATLAETRGAFTESGFSRIPVWRGQPSNLIGTVWIYDILFDAGRAMEDFVKPAIKLPASLSVDAAILTLRNNHATLAFVEDEWDRIVGIVTLKDLVSEIITDLHDL